MSVIARLQRVGITVWFHPHLVTRLVAGIVHVEVLFRLGSFLVLDSDKICY